MMAFFIIIILLAAMFHFKKSCIGSGISFCSVRTKNVFNFVFLKYFWYGMNLTCACELCDLLAVSWIWNLLRGFEWAVPH
jgi:hypothetical protein